MDSHFLSYLHSWYQRSVEDKHYQGIQVDLSFDEFLTLFQPSQLKSLQKSLEEGNIYTTQSAVNDYAYVLTWCSYTARSTNHFNRQTACVCSRLKSRRINMPKAGDVLRPEHRAAIAKAQRGVPKSDDHKKALSDALRGTKKQPWTTERKAARSAQIAARSGAR